MTFILLLLSMQPWPASSFAAQLDDPSVKGLAVPEKAIVYVRETLTDPDFDTGYREQQDKFYHLKVKENLAGLKDKKTAVAILRGDDTYCYIFLGAGAKPHNGFKVWQPGKHNLNGTNLDNLNLDPDLYNRVTRIFENATKLAKTATTASVGTVASCYAEAASQVSGLTEGDSAEKVIGKGIAELPTDQLAALDPEQLERATDARNRYFVAAESFYDAAFQSQAEHSAPDNVIATPNAPANYMPYLANKSGIPVTAGTNHYFAQYSGDGSFFFLPTEPPDKVGSELVFLPSVKTGQMHILRLEPSLSSLKDIGIKMMLYMADYRVFPDIQNTDDFGKLLFEQFDGTYLFNHKLAGLTEGDIAEPGSCPLFYPDISTDEPFNRFLANPNKKLNVVFADYHSKAITAEDLDRYLANDPRTGKPPPQ